MSEQVRILIVDDHPIFRAGLVEVLQSDSRMQIVDQAASAEEFWEKFPACGADIVISDIELPGEDGLSLARKMKRIHSETPILVLTMHKDEGMVNEALSAGVDAYVLKESAATDLIQAILQVRMGGVYLSPAVSGFLVRRKERAEQLRSNRPTLSELSPMEWQVLRELAGNKTSKEIGEALFISHRTVQKHRANICEKIGLQGANRLLEFALRHRDEIEHECP